MGAAPALADAGADLGKDSHTERASKAAAFNTFGGAAFSVGRDGAAAAACAAHPGIALTGQLGRALPAAVQCSKFLKFDGNSGEIRSAV